MKLMGNGQALDLLHHYLGLKSEEFGGPTLSQVLPLGKMYIDKYLLNVFTYLREQIYSSYSYEHHCVLSKIKVLSKKNVGSDIIAMKGLAENDIPFADQYHSNSEMNTYYETYGVLTILCYNQI